VAGAVHPRAFGPARPRHRRHLSPGSAVSTAADDPQHCADISPTTRASDRSRPCSGRPGVPATRTSPRNRLVIGRRSDGLRGGSRLRESLGLQVTEIAFDVVGVELLDLAKTDGVLAVYLPDARVSTSRARREVVPPVDPPTLYGIVDCRPRTRGCVDFGRTAAGALSYPATRRASSASAARRQPRYLELRCRTFPVLSRPRKTRSSKKSAPRSGRCRMLRAIVDLQLSGHLLG